MGPLTGIKIIERTRSEPAQYYGMLLADMGANVASVQRPGYVETQSLMISIERGKHSIILDLKNKDDQHISIGAIEPQFYQR